ncbi:MAG: hypothetical protein IPK83_04290 [Planctomycetes bacterium]|nr:hypothetical protein [Planctomycetota bacterium]
MLDSRQHIAECPPVDSLQRYSNGQFRRGHGGFKRKGCVSRETRAWREAIRTTPPEAVIRAGVAQTWFLLVYDSLLGDTDAAKEVMRMIRSRANKLRKRYNN